MVITIGNVLTDEVDGTTKAEESKPQGCLHDDVCNAPRFSAEPPVSSLTGCTSNNANGVIIEMNKSKADDSRTLH